MNESIRETNHGRSFGDKCRVRCFGCIKSRETNYFGKRDAEVKATMKH